MALQIDQRLTLQFNTKVFFNLNYDDVLNGLQEAVKIDDINAIQLTTNSCNVSVKNTDAKQKLQIDGITVQSRHVKLMDANRQITTATIKDAPFELPDAFVFTQMSQYGQVLQGSLTRGKIKQTNIENGTRYIQMLNVEKPIPNTMKWGRFWVRVFCDNNKTECGYCGDTAHPYFRCPQKAKKQQACFKCLENGHFAWQCKNEVVCSFCKQKGHVKRLCAVAQNAEKKNEESKTTAENMNSDSIKIDTVSNGSENLREEELSASPVFMNKQKKNRKGN